MCSLAACPSLFSLTFAYITLFLFLHPPPSQYGLSDEAIASFSNPQWHLTILICMYMPSLCGRRAAEIDQQRSGMFYYMSVRGRDHTQWANTQTSTCICAQAGMYEIYRHIHRYVHPHIQQFTVCFNLPQILLNNGSPC